MSNLKRWNRRLAKGMAVLLALALFMSGSGMTVLAQEVGEAVSEVVEESTEEEEVVETTEESEEASEEVSEETSSEVSEEVSDAEESEEASEDFSGEVSEENVDATVFSEGVASGVYYGMDWNIDNDGLLTISGTYNELAGEGTFWGDYSESVISAKVTAQDVLSTKNWFAWMRNLTTIDFSEFDTSQVVDMSHMFDYCENLKTLDFSKFDTSNVKDMSYMFRECFAFDEELDLSSFDTSKVKDMSYMFSGMGARTLDISSFDTSKVRDMSYMFSALYTEVEGFDVSGFNTINVEKMDYMFAGAHFLEKFDITNFETDNVVSTNGMFNGCLYIYKLDMSGLRLPNLKEAENMFGDCYSLAAINTPTYLAIEVNLPRELVLYGSGEKYSCLPTDTSVSRQLRWKNEGIESGFYRGMDWVIYETGELVISGYSNDSYYGLDWKSADNADKISHIKLTAQNVSDEMSYWFARMESVKTVDLSEFDSSQVTSLRDLFLNCSNLENVNLSGFDTSNVTDMQYMFYGCEKLKTIDVSGFDTSKVISMQTMFHNCKSLTELDVSNFDMRNVRNVSGMFELCESLKSLNISGFDLQSTTSMSYMFFNCRNLESIKMDDIKTGTITSMNSLFSCCSSLKTVDLSLLDTSQVVSLTYMFSGCSSLEKINLAALDTGQVESLHGMFSECTSLEEVDFGKIDTGKVKNIEYMFSDCSSLKSINWNGFDTTNVTNMGYLFQDCTSIQAIDLSSFDTSNATNMECMFANCTSLKSVDLSGFDTSQVTYMFAMFSGCSSLESVDLRGFDTRNVVRADYMFRDCTSLKNIDLSSFDLSAATEFGGFFIGDDALIKIATPYNMKKDFYLGGEFKRTDTGEVVYFVPAGLEKSITLVRVGSEPVDATKISLNQSAITLEGNQSYQLVATIEPADATDKSVEWTSSAADIASVDSNGLVTAHKVGTATITAKALGGKDLKATCKVTVAQMATELVVKFNKNVNAEGEYVFALNDSVAPAITWDNGDPWPEVIFSVSNDTAAMENGKLVAKKSGSGTLTATAKNGDVTGPSTSVNYRVYAEKVSGITLNQTKVTLDAQSERNSFLLEATIDNADEAYASVEFTTNKPGMIAIYNIGDNKAVVILVDTTPGTATVTATATDGSGKSATCTIVSGTSVESITVSAPLETIANGGYLLGTGKRAKLTAGILPANATAKTVTWASSDAGVAKVDANGTVTAVNPGVAFITATATDGSGVNGTAVINVTRPASAMKLELVDNESGKVGIYYPEGGTAFEVKAVLTGTDGKTDNVAQDVNYTVSGKGAKNVVYLGDGRFAAKAPGVVTVTATAKDGSKVKASKQVTIEQLVYAFDVQAPKNTESYMYQNYEHWIAYIGTKDVTLTPVVTYNDGVKEYAPAKEYQKVEFMLPENGPLSVDKKGTGIVVSKNAEPGMYSVTIKHKNVCELKPVYIDVVKAENTYLKDAAIVLPKNMPVLTDDSVLLAEGSKVKLSASVNGVENLKGYTVTWSVAGNAGNTGSAAISAAGLLDLSGAKASEEYLVTLTVSKGEASVTKMLSVAVTKKTDVSAMKLVLAENQSEALPASFNVQYGNNGKVFKVADQNGAANLYSVTGGKKGVLTIEETEGGYIVLAEGTGSAKLTITALDGSNAKKAITVKVVPAGNPVNKLTMGSKSYSVEPNMPIAIPYSIATKNGKDASDTRVEWTSSNAGILQVSADNADSASESCITTAAKGYLTLVAKTGMTGKVTLTGKALDGSKKTVKVTVNVVNSGKKEVTYKLSLQTPAKTPNGGVPGLALVTYGKSVKLTANVFPNKAKNKTISYTIVGMDENGQKTLSEAELKAKGVTVKKGVVAANKKSTYTGFVQVTATLDYKTYVMGEATPVTASKVLYVQPGVTKVEITDASGSVMKTATAEAGKQLALKAKVTGAGALTYANVSWSVSDSKLASVDTNGMVTIKADAAKGKKVKVTATALDGSKKKAVVTITVK